MGKGKIATMEDSKEFRKGIHRLRNGKHDVDCMIKIDSLKVGNRLDNLLAATGAKAIQHVIAVSYKDLSSVVVTQRK